MAELFGFQVYFGRTAEVIIGILMIMTIGTFYVASKAKSSFLWFLTMVESGSLLFVIGFASVRVARLVEDLPTSKIRSVAMGLVEIKGKISRPFKDFAVSPLKKRKCVWYVLEKYRRSGKSGYWDVIEKFFQPFHLQDGTGSVLVDPVRAAVDAPYVYNSWRDLREKVLVTEQELYILGTAGDNPYKAESTAVKGVEDIMIQSGHAPYYISEKSEHGFVRKYRWLGWFFVVLGSGLFGGGLFLIIAQAI